MFLFCFLRDVRVKKTRFGSQYIVENIYLLQIDFQQELKLCLFGLKTLTDNFTDVH